MSDDADTYAGNPALKLPVLKLDGQAICGSLNIYRALAQTAPGQRRVVWPWDADTPLLMNAHEILVHAMAMEVEVLVHEVVEKRPPDTASRKRRQSLINCLTWLESNLPFRNPMDLSGMPNLLAFETDFSTRPVAQATPYRFDQPPG